MDMEVVRFSYGYGIQGASSCLVIQAILPEFSPYKSYLKNGSLSIMPGKIYSHCFLSLNNLIKILNNQKTVLVN